MPPGPGRARAPGRCGPARIPPAHRRPFRGDGRRPVRLADSVGDGLEITFEQWQYGNTTRTPADGISFFLTDGSGRLTTPGAFGGSLGYAQRLPADRPGAPIVPGVEGGCLGIGLDVIGDYFGDGEMRGNGCARRSPAGTAFTVPPIAPNVVTARGPGNGTEGYCFIGGTASRSAIGTWPSTLPGRLHGDLQDMPARVTPAQAEALLEPVKRTVRLTVPSGPAPVAAVDIDFQDGNGFQQALRFPAPVPVPSTVKFGFAASTGPFTDVHLIRNVTLRSTS
ncbi:MAG: hypothetical protein FWJ90_17815 [Actinomadura sp.]